MKSALTFLCFLVVTISLFSQNDKNIFWGLSFTPKLSVATFDDKELGESNHQIGTNIQPIIGYKLNNRINLISGLIYQLDRLDLKDYDPLFACDFNGTEFDVRNSWIEDRYNIHYSVPLLL